MFNRVVAQDEIKKQLIALAREGHTPHALMLCGPAGCGKLAMALAYAEYLLCQHPGTDDACGKCAACRQTESLAHPDLHFVFPVVRRKGGETVVSDDYMGLWRQRLTHGPYFDPEDWTSDMGGGTTAPVIYAAEAARIQRKLSLKPAEGGRKVMIIWQPEKMNAECATKLLKIVEEPPQGTYFIMVCQDAANVLPTLASRTWRIQMPPLHEESIRRALALTYPPDTAEEAARRAQGSYTAALKEAAHNDTDRQNRLDFFIMLMRTAYARRIKEMKKWSLLMADAGREHQKAFLDYAQKLLRENFVYNFHLPELTNMTPDEEAFAQKFSPFINERNIVSFMDCLTDAARGIEQNANPRIVFFDLALKATVLLLR